MVVTLLIPSICQFTYKKDEVCKKLCDKTYTKGNEESEVLLTDLKRIIEQNYQQHW